MPLTQLIFSMAIWMHNTSMQTYNIEKTWLAGTYMTTTQQTFRNIVGYQWQMKSPSNNLILKWKKLWGVSDFTVLFSYRVMCQTNCERPADILTPNDASSSEYAPLAKKVNLYYPCFFCHQLFCIKKTCWLDLTSYAVKCLCNSSVTRSRQLQSFLYICYSLQCE